MTIYLIRMNAWEATSRHGEQRDRDISLSTITSTQWGYAMENQSYLNHIEFVINSFPWGQDRNNTRKFGINIILILLKVIVK